ncbi:hypothetical protein ROZALSC1DRAFT_29365 [Rozella allomycis CSF55]|uniref:Endoplasmic reticulum vesicle transporter N-terminal domain-containing protein n=1 Tax=Rozella allomycis (strain CSF55) TaxID=988480 RepID=A0A075AYL7_ROZAC|nr:hypothetical protein O9G_005181 [Rozella allomycis CSF55]RKP18992.1 hypothetical protein ROZALSC1DRAFT_29365 [Rozella allomycis CSF55]|eukprot:EPZ35214.1 hypothetical protein O9G_005181 [Rozella allomycis CSF55]
MQTRRRSSLKLLRQLQDIDSFPKVNPELQKKTTTGGFASVVGYVIICLLVLAHLKSYIAGVRKYEFGVANTIQDKIEMFLDISVASDCQDSFGTQHVVTEKMKRRTIDFNKEVSSLSSRCK